MPPRTRRALQLSLLGGLALASLLLIGVRWFSIAFAATGHWQRPALARVQVLRTEHDPFDPVGRKVHVLRHGRYQALRMLREEAAALQPGQELWVLDNLFASPRRPDQFRLGPLRLLTEWPEPLLLLSAWAFWRRLRQRWGHPDDADETRPGKPRRVLTDDFHARADQRRR